LVDLGGGPRNPKLQHGVAYYFYGQPAAGKVSKVASVKFPDLMKDGDYRSIPEFTGKDVRAAEVTGVEFPKLLEPVDDLPPATVITSVRREGEKLIVRGVSQDDGEVESVMINGVKASVTPWAPGLVDWQAVLSGREPIKAIARDRAGNEEKMAHVRERS
jgi:hypothetical protein